MNNKIRLVDDSVTPTPVKSTYSASTAGIEYEKNIGQVRVVPDSSGDRFLVPTLRAAGAPTNGTSGTGAGFMGPGTFYRDTTNKVIYTNNGTKASPTWVVGGGGAAAQPTVTAVTADGALVIGSINGVTKAGVAAMTLAAPTAGAAGTGDDGKRVEVFSDSANAHTVTFTGSKLDSGGAEVLTATFEPYKGASLTVRAYNGRYKVVAANGVSFS